MYQSIGNIHFASKEVAPNDINKGALFVTVDQQTVLSMAGLEPEGGGTGNYTLRQGFWGEGREYVAFTYYGAQRNAARPAEPRIGRLTTRLTVGMFLFVVWYGNDITFYLSERADFVPLGPAPSPDLPPAAPPVRVRGYSGWQRDTEVMAAAKERADYRCEYPGCTWPPFMDAAGFSYVETHHIVPLSEGGPDILENCAALCPGCHRRAHHSSPEEQLSMRQTLLALRGFPGT
ncbi:hypothetical protein CVH10_14735 [Halomonas sp. ND22Bw]|uniref:HNH endonuclease n=1 Tax=Halomonas sp. ND22Bw TaxID=2054178 RepID=UPI000D0BB4CD|nr:hypothetical protein CVH10_14735 [Halomonas sp. ND22Bw]